MRPAKYFKALPRRPVPLPIAARLVRPYSHSSPLCSSPVPAATPPQFTLPASILPPPPANASPQELLAHYSQMPTTLVKLSDLTRYGAPPLSEEKLLDSAERTRKELLAGLARRVSVLVLLWLA